MFGKGLRRAKGHTPWTDRHLPKTYGNAVDRPILTRGKFLQAIAAAASTAITLHTATRALYIETSNESGWRQWFLIM
jgi:hypothetical protein